MPRMPCVLGMKGSIRFPEPVPPGVMAAMAHMAHVEHCPPSSTAELVRHFKPLKRATGPSCKIKVERNKFQINLDVNHFAPDEVTVKVVDKEVIVEASHEEKQDEHGWVTRVFRRRCPLPEGCDVDTVESKLTSDGVLIVTVPLRAQSPTNERVVPIIRTGPMKTQLSEAGKPGAGADDANVESCQR